jgi:hypothetical protein
MLFEEIEFWGCSSVGQRVIQDKRKNVHAYAASDKYVVEEAKVDNDKAITYNPYVAGYFVCDRNEITFARKVLFYSGKCYLIE